MVQVGAGTNHVVGPVVDARAGPMQWKRGHAGLVPPELARQVGYDLGGVGGGGGGGGGGRSHRRWTCPGCHGRCRRRVNACGRGRYAQLVPVVRVDNVRPGPGFRNHDGGYQRCVVVVNLHGRVSQGIVHGTLGGREVRRPRGSRPAVMLAAEGGPVAAAAPAAPAEYALLTDVAVGHALAAVQRRLKTRAPRILLTVSGEVGEGDALGIISRRRVSIFHDTQPRGVLVLTDLTGMIGLQDTGRVAASTLAVAAEDTVLVGGGAISDGVDALVLGAVSAQDGRSGGLGIR